MLFDFSTAPLKNRAFSERPMTFIEQEPKNTLAAIMDVVAIETGNRAARTYWQQKQLQNLIKHAVQKSAFWRPRLGTRNIKNIELTDLPVLTRDELRNQVEAEGSLLPAAGTIGTKKLMTSGSSGTPVSFFVSDMNAQFNTVRSLAQYFMEERDLTLNRTRFGRAPRPIAEGFSVTRRDGSLGPLTPLFRGGIAKTILHHHLNREPLLKELAKDPIGYLVAQPGLIEALFYDCDASYLAKSGISMFIPADEEADEELRSKFSAAQIPVRGVYSSQEVGYIAAECPRCPGAFHVAESNVVIECDDRDAVSVAGKKLGRVLVTHLHSYATPLIRYDIGDFASLSATCACGHDGSVLTNIYGRKKRLLKRADGSVIPFSVTARSVLGVVNCQEYRIRQTALKVIEVDIGGVDRLSAQQTASLEALIRERAGEEFQVHIRSVKNIEWGTDVKKLGFRSEML
jgi:phenylacetate-coenzyme A ligase PaaK-like adenylate-forming protein